jgi:hypothetical protein
MTPSGITADTGFLIGLERHKQRATDLAGYASAKRLLISAPVVVIAEWWRGGRDQTRILRFVKAEEMTERLAAFRRRGRPEKGRRMTTRSRPVAPSPRPDGALREAAFAAKP